MKVSSVARLRGFDDGFYLNLSIPEDKNKNNNNNFVSVVTFLVVFAVKKELSVANFPSQLLTCSHQVNNIFVFKFPQKTSWCYNLVK